MKYVKEFEAALKSALKKVGKDKAKIQKKLDAVDEKIRGLAKQRYKFIKAMDAVDGDIQKALTRGAKKNNIQIESGAGGKPAATTGRLTKEAKVEYCGQLEKLLTKEWMKISVLAAEIGLDKSQLPALLERLKKEKKAESNGKRGRGGAWRAA